MCPWPCFVQPWGRSRRPTEFLPPRLYSHWPLPNRKVSMPLSRTLALSVILVCIGLLCGCGSQAATLETGSPQYGAPDTPINVSGENGSESSWDPQGESKTTADRPPSDQERAESLLDELEQDLGPRKRTMGKDKQQQMRDLLGGDPP